MSSHNSLSEFSASLPAASKYILFNMVLCFDSLPVDWDARQALSKKLKEYDIFTNICSSDRRVDIEKTLPQDVLNNLIRDISLMLRPIKIASESKLTVYNLAWYISGPALNTQTVSNLKKSGLLFKSHRGANKGEMEDEFWLGSEHEVLEVKKIWLRQHPRRSVVIKSACPFGSPLKVKGNIFHALLKEGMELSLRDALESAPISSPARIKI